MKESNMPYKSQLPSSPPPESPNYGNKRGFLENFGENSANVFNENSYYKNRNVLTSGANSNAHLVHIPNNFNVVSPKTESNINLNVAKSNINCVNNGCSPLSNANSDNELTEDSFHSIQSLISKFDSKTPNSANNCLNRATVELNTENKSDNTNYSDHQLKHTIKLGKANLNVVKEFKKDVPNSRLPIMYKDDVEALLSRKPNAVRNFVNSLNKQLNGFSGLSSKYAGLNGTAYGYNGGKGNACNCRHLGCGHDTLDKNEAMNSPAGFTGSDKYSHQSPSLKPKTGPGRPNMNSGTKINFADGKSHGDQMLTYRSNTFGGFSRASTVAELAKSTSELCGSPGSDFMYAGGAFYGSGPSGGYMGGNNQYSYAAHNGSNWGYGNDGQIGWNAPGLSINSSTAASYPLLVVNGDYCDSFNAYFNRHFNGGCAEAGGEGEAFRNAKTTCRTNFTGINAEELPECYYSCSEHGRRLESEPGEDADSGKAPATRDRKLGDLLFNKRFLQSFNTLPEGVNLVIDTPQSQLSSSALSDAGATGRPQAAPNPCGPARSAPKREKLVVNSVNLIKSGWVWVQSSRTKSWVPKFVILFYDSESTQYTSLPLFSSSAAVNPTRLVPSAAKAGSNAFGACNNPSNNPATLNSSVYNVNANLGAKLLVKNEALASPASREKNYNRYFGGDVGANDGFWRIYSLYTQLNPRLQLSSSAASPTSANNGSSTYLNTLIEDNSAIYLCILGHEPDNYLEAVRSGSYLQLYRVDTAVAPYLRSFRSCWLSGFFSRKIGSSVELIIISLVDNYEFCFVPLCAARLNSSVGFTYEMELAARRRIDAEYDGWMFKLWEYAVRPPDCPGPGRPFSPTAFSGSLTGAAGSPVCPNPNANAFGACGLPSANPSDDGLPGGPDPNASASTASSSDVNKGFLARCYDYFCSLFGSGAPSAAVVDDPKTDPSNLRTHIIKSINSNQDPSDEVKSSDPRPNDLPSPRNFINWIDKYGFDDLSIKMNMYTLIKR